MLAGDLQYVCPPALVHSCCCCRFWALLQNSVCTLCLLEVLRQSIAILMFLQQPFIASTSPAGWICCRSGAIGYYRALDSPPRQPTNLPSHYDYAVIIRTFLIGAIHARTLHSGFENKKDKNKKHVTRRLTVALCCKSLDDNQ